MSSALHRSQFAAGTDKSCGMLQRSIEVVCLGCTSGNLCSNCKMASSASSLQYRPCKHYVDTDDPKDW